MKKLILAAALLAASTTTQADYKGNFIDEYAAAYKAPEQATPNTIAKFRADSPGLATTSDAAIARYMHMTDAPDMPEAEFYKSIGYDPSWVKRIGTLLNSHVKIVVSN